MTFSIIINNYNYGCFIKQAIDSALGQKYTLKEVIVVDDGSTDNSAEILQSYGSQIQAILKTNGGQASTYNTGFAKAKGELVLFLDSDDFLGTAPTPKHIFHWTSLIKMENLSAKKFPESYTQAMSVPFSRNSGTTPVHLPPAMFMPPATCARFYLCLSNYGEGMRILSP
jgi:hypothetical protein